MARCDLWRVVASHGGEGGGDSLEQFLAGAAIATQQADEMGWADAEGGGELASFEAAGEPEVAEGI